jgi:hypothetical protein
VTLHDKNTGSVAAKSKHKITRKITPQEDTRQQNGILRRKNSFPFVFDIKSASFYHRSRVSARLVTFWSRDTLLKI